MITLYLILDNRYLIFDTWYIILAMCYVFKNLITCKSIVSSRSCCRSYYFQAACCLNIWLCSFISFVSFVCPKKLSNVVSCCMIELMVPIDFWQDSTPFIWMTHLPRMVTHLPGMVTHLLRRYHTLLYDMANWYWWLQ